MRLRFLTIFLGILSAAMAQIPNVSTMTPASGTAMAATFQFTINNYPSVANFSDLHVVIKPYAASALPLQNECMIVYSQVHGNPVFWGMWLQNDSNSISSEGGPEGQYYVWSSNSYCDIAAGFSHTVNGNSITFTIPVSFKSTLLGPLSIFTEVSDVSGANSGWSSWGGWTAGVSGNPVQSLSGSPGSSITGTYTATATDPAGAGNVSYMEAYVANPGGGAPFNCWILLSGGGLYVLSDAQSWAGPATTGAAVENSNCGVRPNSFSASGNSVSYGFTITLKPTVPAANYEVYAIAVNNEGLESSWMGSGIWSFPVPLTDSTISLLPTDPAGNVFDDFSGGSVRMPTSDAPTIPEVYITQPNTATQPILFGQSYTVVVRGAAPNSQVWGLIDRPSSIGDPTITPYSCPVYPYLYSYQPYVCLTGSTDGNGYFSRSILPDSIGGDTVVSFYVGPQGTDRTLAGQVAQADSVASTYAGSVYFFMQNPITGQPPFTPDAARRVKVGGGKVVSVSAAPRVKVPAAPSSTFERNGAGLYTYHFSLDTREGSIIRVGDDATLAAKATGEEQNGWYSIGVGWLAGDKPQRAADVKLSLSSMWKPGPVAIYWPGAASAIPMQSDGFDNVLVARTMSIFHTSTSSIAIGPAIAPGSSESDLRLIVRDWKDTLGLAFLAPLLDSADWAAGIDSLKPSNDLERSVVDCLRNAL